MSIERDGNLIVFTCDECGDELETGCEDFYQALDELKQQGWKSRRDSRDKPWRHLCPDCY